MSWSGCKTRVVVVSADQVERFVKEGEPTPGNGVWMSEARYQRYRRAVADKILEEQGRK